MRIQPFTMFPSQTTSGAGARVLGRATYQPSLTAGVAGYNAARGGRTGVETRIDDRLSRGFDDLDAREKALNEQLAGISLPVMERQRVNKDEAIGTAIASVLGLLAGARPEYVMPAASNFLAGRQGQLDEDLAFSEKSAMAKAQEEERRLQAQLANVGVDSKSLGREASAIASDRTREFDREMKQQELRSKERIAQLNAQTRKDLSGPELYRAHVQDGLDMGMTFEQADARARQITARETAALAGQREGAALNSRSQAADRDATRPARVAELQSRSGLRKEQAEYWDKRTDLLPRELAIKLGMLNAHLMSVRSMIGDRDFENDLKLNTEGFNQIASSLIESKKELMDARSMAQKDIAAAEAEIRQYQLEMEKNGDPEDSEYKAYANAIERARERREQARTAYNEVAQQMIEIERQIKANNEARQKATAGVANRANQRGTGGRPPAMKGNIPSPGYVTPFDPMKGAEVVPDVFPRSILGGAMAGAGGRK